ncbi:efflux RND transporter periplasmic adaptor subunit [Permianibacter fluminis]|uniref:efflux RND transporter periplasmic adaptor subunit n=1 Tax=Permianibacter fluminis TaxID=2738515 RepID=UPI001B7D8771|nr:efflux RND transporter periplasmic adaptor subunit [Permianibacter fluminis]
MMRHSRFHSAKLRHTVLAASVVLGLAAGLTGCGQPGGPDAAADAAPTQTLLLNRADLLAVDTGEFATGPVISGSLQPERQADLRAEVSAIVLQVFKNNGDKVQKGDLLVRLDDTSLRENLSSSQEAERAAQQAFDQAQRQFERLKTLSSSGAVSTQNLEDAEIRRNNAQSDLAAARARVVQSRQQMEKTEVRAPFAGIVSERAVSNGDTAQVGKALLKVIDPSSLRFEGFIAAEQVNQVKVGNAVLFSVNGYGEQQFAGSVERVSPMANSATRQVEVGVRIQGSGTPMVAGLFAEGRVQTISRSTLMVPESALVRDGDTVYIWKVQDQKLLKTPIQLGGRDERRGDFEVKSGVVAGDQILRHPQGALSDGGAVELETTAVAKAGG